MTVVTIEKNSVKNQLYFSLAIYTLFFLVVKCQVSTIFPDFLDKVIKRVGGCEAIQCDTGITSKSCPTGSVYEEGVTFCNCCPGCVKYERGYLQGCDPSSQKRSDDYDPTCKDLICPILRHCQPGLDCLPTTGGPYACQPTTDRGSDCRNECFIRRAVIEFDNYRFAPRQRRNLPSCTKDGKYETKQCKGTKNDGECFCVDDCGKRIYGRELYENAENMTCGCSKLVHELRVVKNQMATLHCQENGDFEPLQCDTDSGLCYCVNELTGKTTGEVLPEYQFRLLPCYNASDDNFIGNAQYLRVCESEWVAGQEISREAALHGLSYNHRPMECAYDGGHAIKYRDTILNQERCVHRSGAPMNYFRQYTQKTHMDCQCAADSVYFARQGLPFLTECERAESALIDGPQPGSHKLYHINGQYAYCVDIDGYQYGPNIPSQFACCLEDKCSTDINLRCPTDNPNYPYIHCLLYFMGRI